MHFVYFDEAKNDPDYPRYHLGAVVIDEVDLPAIEDRINGLALKAFGTSTLLASTEFHAAEIYHRRKNFKEWKDPEARLALLSEFVDILSLGQVRLVDIQINCDKLHKGQSAEDIGFMFLCERVNSYLASKNVKGMLIGDRESDLHASRYATSLSNYRASGTTFAYGTDITNLVDSVHFTHSHLSRFLQLADVYTWVKQFLHRNASSSEARHQSLLKICRRESVCLYPDKYKEWPK